MNRTYASGNSDNVDFFVGTEIEHTPAYNMKTLFVTGIQTYDDIKMHVDEHNCRHIFFGANHSFNPASADEYSYWNNMITGLLEEDYLCSLDIPLEHVNEFIDLGLCSYNNFIPQIRVPIPYITLWNYNTMIKLDDIGFNKSNPGVWTHSLHELMDRSKFTRWDEYRNDTIIK